MGSFGVLRVGDLKLYTVECPWLDNRRAVSCIPEGVYPMSRGSTFTKKGAEWILRDVPNRSAILIHVANTIEDIKGCIGPGLDLGYIDNISGRSVKKWAVTRSTEACRRFNDAMKDFDTAEIEIGFDKDDWRK